MTLKIKVSHPKIQASPKKKYAWIRYEAFQFLASVRLSEASELFLSGLLSSYSHLWLIIATAAA